MNSLKRRRLNASRVYRILQPPGHSNPTIDEEYSSLLIAQGYQRGNSGFSTSTVNVLVSQAPIKGVPIECCPVVAGLCTTKVRQTSTSSRPRPGDAIITCAETSERAGVTDFDDASSGRIYPLVDVAQPSFNTYATFQYHGVMHTRQSIPLPYSLTNVDTLMTRFNGSIPCPSSNAFKPVLMPLYNQIKLEHALHIDVADAVPCVVGSRQICFERVSINQGKFRRWLLSPGSVVQTHTVSLSSKRLYRRHLDLIFNALNQKGWNVKVLSVKKAMNHSIKKSNSTPATKTLLRNQVKAVIQKQSLDKTDNATEGLLKELLAVLPSNVFFRADKLTGVDIKQTVIKFSCTANDALHLRVDTIPLLWKTWARDEAVASKSVTIFKNNKIEEFRAMNLGVEVHYHRGHGNRHAIVFGSDS